MSKNSLLSKFKTSDVKYISLEDLLDYEQPTKYIVKSTKYNDDFNVPVLTAGQSFILGYTNEDSGIYDASENKPVIIFDDFTTNFHWVDFNFKVKSSAMKILKPKSNDVNFRYIYYAMSVISFTPQNHSRHWISVYSKFQIPVPSLETQNEIVKILDKFEKQIKINSEKLELCNEQMNWLKFNFFKKAGDSETKKLDDCCELKKGKTPIQKAVPGEYPLVVTTKERKSCDKFDFDKPSVCVPLVSSRGHGIASLNQVFYQEGKYAVGNILCVVTPKDYEYLNAEYLYYYLNFFKDTKIVSLMKGGANVSLTVDSLKGVEIEIPDNTSQIRIVSKLRECDKMTELMVEKIELLKKQYEYYRDKILRFKEAKINE